MNNLTCNQIMLSVTDIESARNFYLNKLGLSIIEDHPKMFACRAGEVRLSILAGAESKSAESPITIMLRTSNIKECVRELQAKGVMFDGEIETAPGFMKHIGLEDPDGNYFYIAEYMRDPLEPI